MVLVNKLFDFITPFTFIFLLSAAAGGYELNETVQFACSHYNINKFYCKGPKFKSREEVVSAINFLDKVFFRK